MSTRSDVKKRLLLSKWRGDLESLRENAQQHKKDVAELTDKLDLAESSLKEAEDDLETAREAHVDEIATMEAVLVDVKYWFHSGLVLHKLVSDPRALLRKIEGVL